MQYVMFQWDTLTNREPHICGTFFPPERVRSHKLFLIFILGHLNKAGNRIYLMSLGVSAERFSSGCYVDLQSWFKWLLTNAFLCSELFSALLPFIPSVFTHFPI